MQSPAFLSRLRDTGRAELRRPAASTPVDRPLDQEHVMKAKIAGMVIALAAMAPVQAAENDDVERLAEYSGLTVRKVQMILGARTSFAEYSRTYQRSLEKFRKALGTENYDQLMAGRPIKLDNGIEVQVQVASVE
jgi:opacity protein-like surface antigen